MSIVNRAKDAAVTSRPDIKYATFNRRLIAATIDLCIMMLLFIPLMAPVQYLVFGNMNFADILTTLKTNSSSKEIDAVLLWEVLKRSGFFFKFFLMNFISFVLIFFIIIFCWIKYNNTPGKWLLGCRMVDANTYQTPTRKQYIIRFFAYIIATLPIYLGFLSITWDKRKQGWHDKMAKTVVIIERHDFTWFFRLKEKLNVIFRNILSKAMK